MHEIIQIIHFEETDFWKDSDFFCYLGIKYSSIYIECSKSWQAQKVFDYFDSPVEVPIVDVKVFLRISPALIVCEYIFGELQVHHDVILMFYSDFQKYVSGEMFIKT